MSFIDRHVGAQLRNRREQLQKTTGDVASEIGIGECELKSMEMGEIRVSAARLEVLCRVLKISPAEIYKGVGDRS